MLGSIGTNAHALTGQVTRIAHHAGHAAVDAGVGARRSILQPVDRLRITERQRVIGSVEGIDVLANPRLPNAVRDARWAVPVRGDLFGWSAKVSPEHVDQGVLGDCWFLSTLASVADADPDRLLQMIRDAGDHVIVEFPGGPVAVTKELPVGSFGPRLGGSDDGDFVHWPSYMEKAFATATDRGYQAMDGNWPAVAFAKLYGTTARMVDKPTAGPFRDSVAALRRGEPIVLSSSPKYVLTSAEKRLQKELGVVPQHAYSPIAVEDAGAGVRLFNPWGTQHPTRALARDELDAMFFRSDTPRESRMYLDRFQRPTD